MKLNSDQLIILESGIRAMLGLAITFLLYKQQLDPFIIGAYTVFVGIWICIPQLYSYINVKITLTKNENQ